MGTLHEGGFPKVVDFYSPRIPANGSVLTVLIVDDQSVFRNVAKSVLERDGSCSVVGEASCGADAIQMIDECRPDVVVMDIQMSDIGGIEATRRILAANPGTNVVLMSMGSDAEYPVLAREVGARGFLPKRNLSADVLRELLGIGPEPDSAALAA